LGNIQQKISEWNADPKRAMRLVWAWLGAWCVLRVLFAGTFPLAPDEANYWQWGRHLDLSYHDQAPMIGWTIALFTFLFGDNEVAVRLPSILSMGVASVYMVLMARRFFGERTAMAVALLSQGVLEFNVGGLMATADGVQAAGWAAAAYHAARAYEEDTWRQWLLAGLWLGFGLLSKYTMVIFAAGAFCYGAFSHQHRWRLAGPKPWVAVALAVALFSPVLFWNHAHGWNSAKHVAHIGGAGESFGLHLKYLLEYLGSQLGLLSPLVFLLVCMAWNRALFSSETRKNWFVTFCLWTSLPMFGGFLLLSLHNRVYGNWPGAGFITATVLAAALYATGARGVWARPRPRLFKWTLGMSYAMTLLVFFQAATQAIPIPASLDRTATELSGWDTVGEKAGEMRADMPRPDKTFLFGIRYQEASQLAFYTPGKPWTASINRWGRPNVYDYWLEDKDILGWDAVGLTKRVDSLPDLLPEVFERVEGPFEHKVVRKRPFGGEQVVRTLYFWRGYGFKGGLRVGR
jgi:undecaprenyl-diphosphatase